MGFLLRDVVLRGPDLAHPRTGMAHGTPYDAQWVPSTHRRGPDRLEQSEWAQTRGRPPALGFVFVLDDSRRPPGPRAEAAPPDGTDLSGAPRNPSPYWGRSCSRGMLSENSNTI